MIKTSKEELGEAYNRASQVIMDMEPVTPRIMGALWREHFGLHHRSKTSFRGFWEHVDHWIEFPDDRDYTAFMLRFA